MKCVITKASDDNFQETFEVADYNELISKLKAFQQEHGTHFLPNRWIINFASDPLECMLYDAYVE